jgi:ABC-type phosphate transport system substrate-binding protein
MKTNFKPATALALVVVLLWLATWRLLALEGGAVVISNPEVAPGSLTPSALKDILTGKTKYWDGGQSIVIVVLPDKTDAGLKAACGMDSSEFKTFWQRLAFSGRGAEPKRVSDEAALVSLVAATKGAIAIAPAGAVLNGVKVIDVK